MSPERELALSQLRHLGPFAIIWGVSVPKVIYVLAPTEWEGEAVAGNSPGRLSFIPVPFRAKS